MIPSWMYNTLSATEDGFFLKDQEEQIPEDAPVQNPYVMLARALLKSRQGNFSIADDIAETLKATGDEDAWNSGGYLLAHAVTHDDLYKIGHQLMATEKGTDAAADFTRSFICKVWARAMMLTTVPEMIEIYKKTSDVGVQIRILLELADMFESARGDLYDLIRVGAEDFDEKAYLDLLMEQYSSAIKKVAKTGTKLFYRGSPFSFLNWTQGLLKRIADFDPRENFATDRMFFEGHTGIRCNHFFTSNGKFLPHTAAATIEDFLESESSSNYKAGVRYFFGHRIPD